MLITVCDVPKERRTDVETAGGELARIYDGLMDVQFKSHKMLVSEDYVDVWQTTTKTEIKLNNSEFSRIYIQ